MTPVRIALAACLVLAALAAPSAFAAEWKDAGTYAMDDATVTLACDTGVQSACQDANSTLDNELAQGSEGLPVK